MSLHEPKIPQHDDFLDSDEIPRKYHDQVGVVEHTQQGNIAGGVMSKSHDDSRKSGKPASSHDTSGRTSNRHSGHSSSPEAASGVFSKFSGFWRSSPSPLRNAASAASSRNPNESVRERRSIGDPPLQHLEEYNKCTEAAISYSLTPDFERKLASMQNASTNKAAEWDTREQELCQQIKILTQNLEDAHNQYQKERQLWDQEIGALDQNLEITKNQHAGDYQLWAQKEEDMVRNWDAERSGLQSKLQETASEKEILRMQLDDFVLKQQEASFKQMDSARWLSMDDSKAMHELGRLKKDMRTWAKSNAAKDIPLLASLEEPEATSLENALSRVVALKDRQLPDAILKNSKAPLILLSALLAHDVYQSFFVNPFSFLGKQTFQVLTPIYQRMQAAAEQDAHLWRAQTLRLLMPPTRENNSAVELELRDQTKSYLSKYASCRVMRFAEGPARHLMGGKPTESMMSKLKRLYNEAARLSYQLWTRRINMRCVNLQQEKNLKFNAESTRFDLDPLVRYDEDENEFNGREIVVLMHPILLVYGNDEGDNYDQESVFAKGVVWLDGKKD